MNVENALYPGAEGVKALLAATVEGPVVMVNLLKFRERAVYSDGRPDDSSGAEAYMRYADRMRAIVESAGGRLLFSGDVKGLIVGVAEELWDVVGLVEYPSVAEFRRITTSPEVQAIGVHREAGLAGQLLIMTTQR